MNRDAFGTIKKQKLFFSNIPEYSDFLGRAIALPFSVAGLVFPCFKEHYIRITLLGQIEIDHCWGDIGEVVAAV